MADTPHFDIHKAHTFFSTCCFNKTWDKDGRRSICTTCILRFRCVWRVPLRCTDVLMERIVGTMMYDAAIYAGKSQDVIIQDTETHGTVIGIELENTVNGEADNNYAHDNTIGIFIDLLPQLPSKVSMNTKVHDNVSENNYGDNFSPEASVVSIIPPGTGMLVLAADEVEISKTPSKATNRAAWLSST